MVPRLEGGPRSGTLAPEPQSPPLPILPPLPLPLPPPNELVDEMELCFVEEEVVESPLLLLLFQMDLKLEKSILVKPRSCSSSCC